MSVVQVWLNKLTFVYSGISALLAPQLVKLTLEEYGYKGTLIIVCGFMLQTFIAVALMQPAAWHMTKVEVPEENTHGKALIDGVVGVGCSFS